ncbi:hypothetical protein P7K49_009070, partial [Saguinus oedipus]
MWHRTQSAHPGNDSVNVRVTEVQSVRSATTGPVNVPVTEVKSGPVNMHVTEVKSVRSATTGPGLPAHLYSDVLKYNSNLALSLNSFHDGPSCPQQAGAAGCAVWVMTQSTSSPVFPQLSLVFQTQL